MDQFDAEVRNAYKTYAEPTVPCVTPEDLDAFYGDELAPAAMDQVRAHLASCDACLELARDYCVFTGSVRAGGEARARQREASSDDRPQSITARSRAVIDRPYTSQFLKIAAGILLVVAVGITGTMMFRSPDTNVTTRGVEPRLEPRVVSPQGKLTEPPRVLEWEAADSAQHYDVEIQDARFNIVWEQRGIKDLRVNVPEDVFQGLPDGTYAWRVFAVNANGRRLVSPFAAFEVAR